LAADLLGDELERIVGVSEYTDYPPKLAGRAVSVGSYAKFSVERVLSLKPDLVLATKDGNPKDQVLQLRELGLPVVVVGTDDFNGIEHSMLLVGDAVGVPDKGREMARVLRKGLEAIRARAVGRPVKHVLLQIGDQPLIAVGGGVFLNEAVSAIGAKNIYADQSVRYPRPSVEDVLKRNPEVIVVAAMGKERALYERMARQWKQFTGVAAVKNGQIKVVFLDELLRPSLRFLNGMALLERAVYGH
jgi:iron complex transport system substrate-binding protein